jgi:hypothetical protein
VRAFALNSGKNGQARLANHNLRAAQCAVKLWHAFAQFGPRPMLLNPSDLAERHSPVLPDFVVIVRLGQGAHAFALEFQTRGEAKRSTHSKLSDYWVHFAHLKVLTEADFFWTLFILERDRLWVEQEAQGVSEAFAYFVSANDFFESETPLTAPVYFAAHGIQTTLVEPL